MAWSFAKNGATSPVYNPRCTRGGLPWCGDVFGRCTPTTTSVGDEHDKGLGTIPPLTLHAIESSNSRVSVMCSAAVNRLIGMAQIGRLGALLVPAHGLVWLKVWEDGDVGIVITTRPWTPSHSLGLTLILFWCFSVFPFPRGCSSTAALVGGCSIPLRSSHLHVLHTRQLTAYKQLPTIIIRGIHTPCCNHGTPKLFTPADSFTVLGFNSSNHCQG